MIVKKAFTLAEVLITLGIIGVVAALTIPTLIQNYREKVTVIKVKKMYSTLVNAYELYKVKNGAASSLLPYSEEGAKQVAEIFRPYLKIAKDCGTMETDCAVASSYKHNCGTGFSPHYGTDNRYYKVILNDGSLLFFRGGADEKYVLEVFYDVNGKNDPNQWGHDIFQFQVQPDDNCLTAYGHGKSKEECAKDIFGCTAWLIFQGNMDYTSKLQ